jgi:hypothetical protein
MQPPLDETYLEISLTDWTVGSQQMFDPGADLRQ